MDPKFVALVRALQETKNSLFLSCIVQGTLVTGLIISEQRFFVEMNRAMNDEFDSPSEARKYWEELLLSTAKIPIENAALHLAGVKVYLPNGILNFPVLRIDPSQVSAWAFLPPAKNEVSSQTLAKILGIQPLDSSQ